MSTSYGLHCKPCDSFSGDGMQYYAYRALSDLARISPLIKQIREKDRQGYIDMTFLGWQDRYDGSPLFDWLHEHAGHKMEIYDEYGRVEPLEDEAIS
jgi:hypothetical protein